MLSYTILPESRCNRNSDLLQMFQTIIVQVYSGDFRAELRLVEILVEGIFVVAPSDWRKRYTRIYSMPFTWIKKNDNYLNQFWILGFQYSPSPLPNANGFEPPPARVINGWTVDDQINKSKMWLKQRNQQMMSRK